jgi:hypothetical protein
LSLLKACIDQRKYWTVLFRNNIITNE